MEHLYTIIMSVIGCFEVIAIILAVVGSHSSKKLQFNTIKEYVSTLLPSLINIAEDTGATGEKKNDIVLTSALQLVQKKFGVLKDSDLSNLTDYIKCNVESILSTPTKKKEVK